MMMFLDFFVGSCRQSLLNSHAVAGLTTWAACTAAPHACPSGRQWKPSDGTKLLRGYSKIEANATTFTKWSPRSVGGEPRRLQLRGERGLHRSRVAALPPGQSQGSLEACYGQIPCGSQACPETGLHLRGSIEIREGLGLS